MLSREGRGTGGTVAVDLVNTWDEFEREPDRLRSIADVRRWLEWHGIRALLPLVSGVSHYGADGYVRC